MARKRIILKFGSSTIADEAGRINADIMEQLIAEIVYLLREHEVLLVSSAAVRLGRSAQALLRGSLQRYRDLPYSKEILREQMLAAVGQGKLITYYLQAFGALGVECAQLLTTTRDFAERERYVGLRTVTVNLLTAGVVPIFNQNDPVFPDLHVEAIENNDQLAVLVAVMVGAHGIVVVSDVDGFRAGPPNDPVSPIVPVIQDVEEYLPMVDDSITNGKGGMTSKLRMAQLAMALGLDMHIVNGRTDHVVTRALAGEQIGTYFPAHEIKLSDLKKWLRTAPAQGRIVVSTTLADAYCKKSAVSVLCAGIDQVQGTFANHAVVEVYDDKGRLLGKGQTRLSSAEIETRMKFHVERRSQGITGDKADIAIHYDYFTFA